MVVGAEDHVALQKKRIGGDSLGVLVKKAKLLSAYHFLLSFK